MNTFSRVMGRRNSRYIKLLQKETIPVDKFKGSEPTYQDAFAYAFEYCKKHNTGLKLMPNTNYPVKQIKVPTYGYIDGSGATSRITSVGDNDQGALVVLEDKDVRMTVMRSFAIDGNMSEQTVSGRNYATNPIHAMLLDNEDSYWGDPWYEDPYHIIEHIFIFHCKGSGIYVPSKDSLPPPIPSQKFQGCLFNHVVVKNIDGTGINLQKGSDHQIVNCVTAGCKDDGYRINGGNNFIGCCKSYYNGIGLYIDEDGTGTKVVGFESQEDKIKGIVLRQCYNSTLMGVTIDSCGFTESGGVVTPGNGIGLEIDGAINCDVSASFINRDRLAGQIELAVNFKGNARGNTVNGKCTWINADGVADKPMYYPISTVPITNKAVIDGVTYTSRGVSVEESILPNVPDTASKMVTVGADVTVPGWSAARQDGITAAFTFDTTEKCQKVAISASTTENAAYISTIVPCVKGDVLDIWALVKTVGDVGCKVQINWLKGTSRTYITGLAPELNPASGTLITNKGYDKSVLSVTAPDSGDVSNPTSAAQILIAVLPTAATKTGSMFIKAFSVQHSAFSKESFARTYPGTPANNVLPLTSREEIFDITNSKWYKAVGLQAANWVALN